MREDFDYLDNILFQSIKDIKVKKYSDNRIQEIMIKAKFKKKEKHKLILKVSVIISFLFISIFSIAKYSINNYIDKENIITINNEKNLDNNVIEYESSDNGTGSSYTELTPKELFELANYVAVVKIENGLKGVNYDREYSAKYNGEYHYTYVRTIGKMNVIEVFKGNINIGDTLEFRKKGGKILYSEYLKYFEENKSAKINDEIQKRYNELISNGISNIYINFKSTNSIEIEEEKKYLVYITKKSWGDLWLESGLNAIREYNSDNNMVLNNYSGKWEPINIVLNAGE